MLPGTAPVSSPSHPQGTGPVVVRHLRQVMLWPLRLIPVMMAYLAVEDPRRLTRNDFVRLGLVVGGEAAGHGGAGLPYAEQHLADFEQRFCYNRFWSETGAAPNTRYLCSGMRWWWWAMRAASSMPARNAVCWRSSDTSTSCSS